MAASVSMGPSCTATRFYPFGQPDRWRSDRAKIWRRTVAACAQFDPSKYGYSEGLADDLAEALPYLKRRLQGCGQSVISGSVSVGLSPQGVAHAKGTASCDCPGCPDCASRDENRRTAEFNSAMQLLETRGCFEEYEVFHFVGSFRHSLRDHQAENIRAFTRAARRFRRSRAYRKLAGTAWAFEFSGSCRRGNGRHPHMHLYVWLRRGIKHLLVALELQEAFYRALQAEGLSANWGAPDPDAIDGWWTRCTDIDAAGRYLCRPTTWGMSEELNASQAKDSHRLVNQAIEDIALTTWALHGCRRHGASGFVADALKEVAATRKDNRPKATSLLRASASTWRALQTETKRAILECAERLSAEGYSEPTIREALAQLVAEDLEPIQPFFQWIPTLEELTPPPDSLEFLRAHPA